MTATRLALYLLACMFGYGQSSAQEGSLGPGVTETRIEALEQRAEAVRSNLELLSTQVSDAQAAAAEAQQGLEALSALRDRVTSQNENVTTLNESVQLNQEALTEQQARLDELTRLTETVTSFENVAAADPEMLATLTSRIEALEAMLENETALSGGISAFTDRTEALKIDVDRMQARLEALETSQLENAPDGTLLQRFKSIDAQTTALAEAVDQLRDTDAAMDERLSNIDVIEAEAMTLKGRLDALTENKKGESEMATSESVELIDRKIEALNQTLETIAAAAETDRQTTADLATRMEIEAGRIEPLILRIDSQTEQFRSQTEVIENHEGRIEDNSLKIYEILIETENMTDRLEQALRASTGSQRRSGFADEDDQKQSRQSQSLEALQAVTTSFALALTLIAPFGLFLMRTNIKGTNNQSAEAGSDVALAWAAGATGFVLLGSGLLLGPSLGGLIGNPSEHLAIMVSKQLGDIDSLALRMIAAHAALAGLAGLIACSSVPGLTLLQRFIVATLFGALAYPLTAHWLRDGQTALGGAQGWMATRGFLDPGGTAGLAAVSGLGAIFLRRALVATPLMQPKASPSPGETSGALILWAGWLGAALIAPEPLSTPTQTALAATIGSAGGCVLLFGLGKIFNSDGRWVRRLAAAALAGGIAGPAASIGAPLLHCMLIGALAAGLFVALMEARADPDGVTVPACAVAAGGLAATLAPALVGPSGLVTRGTFEAFLSQGYGLIAFVVVSLVAGYGCAWITRTMGYRFLPETHQVKGSE